MAVLKYYDGMDWIEVEGGTSGPPVIDSYEDQDFAEYDLELDGGAAEYDFITTNAQDGDVSARLVDNTGWPYVASTGGLDYYPGEGDRIVFWAYNSIGTSSASNCQFGIWFAGNDFDNAYFIRHRVDSGFARFDRNSDTYGNTSWGKFNVDVAAGWNKYILEWDDGSTFGGTTGEMTLTIEDDSGTVLGSGSGSDPDDLWDGSAGSTPMYGMWGGIEAGEHILWDYAHITNR